MDFPNLESLNFTAHLWDREIYEGCGCGFNALALLTNVNPLKIRRKYKRTGPKHSHPNNCNLEWALQYLKRWYDVFEVRPEDLTHPTQIKNNISDKHILLLIQGWLSTENTYVITYNGTVWHNWHSYPLSPFEFLNRSPEQTFILKKK